MSMTNPTSPQALLATAVRPCTSFSLYHALLTHYTQISTCSWSLDLQVSGCIIKSARVVSLSPLLDIWVAPNAEPASFGAKSLGLPELEISSADGELAVRFM